MNLGKVGVIFNGGGFSGAFSVGFAKAIWKAGIRPQVIQGVSVGALSASKIVEDGIEGLEKIWLDIEKAGPSCIFNWWDIAKSVFNKSPSLFRNSGVMRLVSETDLRKVVESETLLQIITRNESRNWEKHVFLNHENRFREDPQLFGQTIVASAAPPGALEPVKIGDEWHSDGLGYSLTSMIATGCDTIFLLLNDQANDSQIRWDQRLSISRHILYEENVGLRLERILQKHKDFDIIFDNEADESEIPLSIKKMKKAVKSVRSVVSSAVKGEDINLVPHRIFVLHTKKPITTLHTFGFSKGDIKAAKEIGEYQAQEVLKKIMK